jgi:uncharacterized membrane protein
MERSFAPRWRPSWATVRYALLLAVYAYPCWLLWKIMLPYVTLRDDVAFLAIKQDYVGMAHYRAAFFTHVFTSIFVLPAGFTQFSTTLLRRAPRVHRAVGALYAAVTVLLAGPSGLVMGVYANGGVASQISFCLLSVLWIGSTIVGVRAAQKRRIAEHRRWMLRSFALACSAITLRAWKLALVLAFHPKPMDVYRVVAWLGWVGNLAVIELWLWHESRGIARGNRPRLG